MTISDSSVSLGSHGCCCHDNFGSAGCSQSSWQLLRLSLVWVWFWLMLTIPHLVFTYWTEVRIKRFCSWGCGKAAYGHCGCQTELCNPIFLTEVNDLSASTSQKPILEVVGKLPIQKNGVIFLDRFRLRFFYTCTYVLAHTCSHLCNFA